jgi:hypothetical protein
VWTANNRQKKGERQREKGQKRQKTERKRQKLTKWAEFMDFINEERGKRVERLVLSFSRQKTVDNFAGIGYICSPVLKA